MKRIFGIWVLILSLLLSGCGGQQSTTSGSDASSVSTDATTAESGASSETSAATSAEASSTEASSAEASSATSTGEAMLYTADTLPDYEAKAREVIVDEDSVTFVDATGKTKTVAKNPERVVGLYPSHIVLWYEAGGSMVGRITTKNSEKNMPEAAKDIEIVGDTTAPDKLSYEKIMAVQPSLVILGIGSQMAMVDTFAELGVDSIVIDNETFDDYLKWVKVIANLYNKPEIYDEVKRDVLEPIQALLLQIPKLSEEDVPKALMMAANDKGTLVAYLPGTTAAGIMAELGVVNVAVGMTDKDHKKTDGIDKAELSFESILTNQPDYILLKHADMESGLKARDLVRDTLKDNPVWTSLTAVVEDSIYDLPPKFFHYKPTKEYVEAYQYLARIFYPDVFGVQDKEFE